MNFTPLNGNPHFWNDFAPWYENWIRRGEYHRLIVKEISHMIEPGWEVLDIGAGTGALSIPLSSLGCNVRALEPFEGMRDILNNKIKSLNIRNIHVYSESWDKMPVHSVQGLDLVIACNSLHLYSGGLMQGMSRVFETMANYICLVTEINQGISIDFKEIDKLQLNYSFLYIKNLALNSSFYFENMNEVREIEALLNHKIKTTIEDGRLVQKDTTDAAVLWWEKRL